MQRSYKHQRVTKDEYNRKKEGKVWINEHNIEHQENKTEQQN